MKNKSNPFIKLFRIKKKEAKWMELKKCIYSYNEFNFHRDQSYWGNPRRFAAISGSEAKRQAKIAGFKLDNKLIDTCLYIFRLNLKGDRLVPARVTMHPNTMANIAKGSSRYGSGHIMNEIIEEGW